MELFRSKHLLFFFNFHLQLEEERKRGTFFSLFCTDLSDYWSLEQSERDFVTAFETLNPSLEAPPARVSRHISESLRDAIWKSAKDGSALKLESESTLAMLPFRWTAKLSRAEMRTTNFVFLRPLLELCRQQLQSEQRLFEAYRQQSRELNKLAVQFGIPESKIKSPAFKDLEAFKKSQTDNDSSSSDPLDEIFSSEFCRSRFLTAIRSSSGSPRSAPVSPEVKKKLSPSAPIPKETGKTITEEERRLQLKKKLELGSQKNKAKKKKKLL